MSPTHEDVEEFFIDFAREMRNQGLFIMDNYLIEWPGLPTKDEVRTMNVEDSESDSEYDTYQ